MKRFVFVVVAFLLLIPVIGCSSGYSQEEIDAAEKERALLGGVIGMAMYDLGVQSVNPCHITNAPGCKITYGDGVILPADDYIVGGFEALKYEYDIGFNGGATPTTGPLAK